MYYHFSEFTYNPKLLTMQLIKINVQTAVTKTAKYKIMTTENSGCSK